MLNEKAPRSVWSVAFIAILLFVIATAVTGLVPTAETGAIAASL